MIQRYSIGRIVTWITVLFIAVLIYGCSSKVNVQLDESNVSFGTPARVVNGDLIVEETLGEVEVKRRWVGILNSPDGWSEPTFVYSDDYLERKLYYQGITDSTVYLIYREYARGEQEASVDKTLQFDLNATLFLDAKPYLLRVDDIDETSITITVLDEATWGGERQNDFQQRKLQAEQQEVMAIVTQTNELLAEIDGAKNYVDKFINITPNLSSYTEASSYYALVLEKYHSNQQSGQDIAHADRLASLNALNRDFAELHQYFIEIATAMEKWEYLDNDMATLHQAVGDQEFLQGAMALKKAGETSLMAGDFVQATKFFTMSENQLNRLMEPN